MQSPNTFSLSFWIDSTRVKNNGVTVFARITVKGKRANISLKRKVSLSEWDSNKCKARGNKRESRLLNRYLDQVKNRVYQAHDELVKEKAFISA